MKKKKYTKPLFKKVGIVPMTQTLAGSGKYDVDADGDGVPDNNNTGGTHEGNPDEIDAKRDKGDFDYDWD